jgi:S1-C subfamily serine protease
MLRRAATLLIAFALVAVGFVAGTSVMSIFANERDSVELLPVQQQQAPDLSGLSESERSIAEIYQRSVPSVVSINVNTGFGGGGGSGFVIDTEGHIVTNFHVVDQAQSDGIEVNFYDGTIVPAEIVGLDPDSDLAVIRVDLPAERLQPIAFGNSQDLVVGQTVVAIGSPFGEEWTLTSGIVSALERTISGLNQYETEQGFGGSYSIGAVIQTDAAINPGNSGGPLINLAGEVVGVNAQIRTETGGNTGIGFAIPSVLAERVAQELIAEGEVDYSLIGISGQNISLNAIEGLDLPNNQRGFIVGNVVPGGPAAEAGLRNAARTEDASYISGDIVTAINGEPLDSIDDLIAYLALNTKPGDVVNLTVLREGETLEIPVTLAERQRASR